MSYTETEVTRGDALLVNAERARKADLDFLIDSAATRVFNPVEKVQIFGVGEVYAEIKEQRVAIVEVRRRFYELLQHGYLDITTGFPGVNSLLDNGKLEEAYEIRRGLLRIASNQITSEKMGLISNEEIVCGLATSKVHYPEGWVKINYGKMCYQNEIQKRALVDLGMLYQKGLREGKIVYSSLTGLPVALDARSQEAMVLISLNLSFERNKQHYILGHPQSVKTAEIPRVRTSTIEPLK